MSATPDSAPPRFNERLDHLQAGHPFRYNLVTGALIGLVLVGLGLHLVVGVAYALSWAVVRACLWGDGRILQRQYGARVVRVAAEKEAKRRRRF